MRASFLFACTECVEDVAPSTVPGDYDNTLSWIIAESDVHKIYLQVKLMDLQDTWYQDEEDHAGHRRGPEITTE
eukprot:12901961-Prorocentrum_lima.AAC.1